MRRMFTEAGEIPRRPEVNVAEPASTMPVTSKTILDTIRKQAMERARADPEYITHEGKLDQHRAAIRDHLTATYPIAVEDLRVDYNLEDALKTWRSSDPICAQMHDALDMYQRDAKAIRRRLQRRFVTSIKKERLEEAKKNLEDSTKRAGTGHTIVDTTGGVPGPQLTAVQQSRANKNAVELARHHLALLEGIAGDDDGEGIEESGPVPTDQEEEEDDPDEHTRLEPAGWDVFEGVDVVDIELPTEPDAQPATSGGRLAFVNRFADLRAMPTSELACFLCQLDDTITYEDKKTTYTRSKLKRHINGPTHRREEQLRRAFIIDMDVEQCADCPLCGETIEGPKNFVKHCEAEHDEQMEF